MEKYNNWEQKSVIINELAQGRELARQLQIHLNAPSNSSHGTRELLVQQIIVSYEKVLSMLNSSSSASPSAVGLEQQPTATGGGVTIRMVAAESPPSLNGSPRSEDSDREFKDHDPKDPSSRKRKTLPSWTKQVKVTLGMGLEGPLDDGFSWRKYGQKDILGAKYPRGYYRCTYRNVQGCLATKQVQRSDEDPTILEITYRGRHTCTQGSSTINPPPPPPPPPPHQQHNHPPEHNQQQSQDMLLSLSEGLRVITEGLDNRREDHLLFPTFNYPSALNVKAEDQASLPSMISNYVGNYSPSFMSHATSGRNYLSVSTQQQGFGGQAEIAEIMSAAATTSSATNSPTVGLDFPFAGQAHDQLYPNFTFEDPGFFP